MSKSRLDSTADTNAKVAARCFEIQSSVGIKEIPEFEDLVLIGMAVKLSLHIRGLALIDYEILKLVASSLLDIPRLAIDRVIRLLADIEFVSLQQTGSTITGVLPTVPYYETLFGGLGEYLMSECNLTEAEQLSLALVDSLSKSPEERSRLMGRLGAESSLFGRNLEIGMQGGFLIERRARGRDIILSPNYFAENADIFADHVAAGGAGSVQRVLESLQTDQGWPLRLVAEEQRIGSASVDAKDVLLLKRLAQDGIVKPPTITTSHSGENHFLFSPAPGSSRLTPLKRDIYEKAMGIVAAIRQGQLLPREYAIRSPGAVLYKLKTDLRLAKATTEARQQYKNLVHLRVGRLVPVGSGFYEFHIIDTPENREALQMAYDLVSSGGIGDGYEVDEAARRALQEDQTYVESLISASQLRQRETIQLPPEESDQLELLFLRGVQE